MKRHVTGCIIEKTHEVKKKRFGKANVHVCGNNALFYIQKLVFHLLQPKMCLCLLFVDFSFVIPCKKFLFCWEYLVKEQFQKWDIYLFI